jgi:hypothetical protein
VFPSGFRKRESGKGVFKGVPHLGSSKGDPEMGCPKGCPPKCGSPREFPRRGFPKAGLPWGVHKGGPSRGCPKGFLQGAFQKGVARMCPPRGAPMGVPMVVHEVWPHNGCSHMAVPNACSPQVGSPKGDHRKGAPNVGTPRGVPNRGPSGVSEAGSNKWGLRGGAPQWEVPQGGPHGGSHKWCPRMGFPQGQSPKGRSSIAVTKGWCRRGCPTRGYTNGDQNWGPPMVVPQVGSPIG